MKTWIFSLILILICVPSFGESGATKCRRAKTRVKFACLGKIDRVPLPPSATTDGYATLEQGLATVNDASVQLEDAMQSCTTEHAAATSECESALSATMDDPKGHARAMDDLNDVDELFTNGQTNYQNKRDAIIAAQTNLQNAR
jgi:hypothetical protein